MTADLRPDLREIAGLVQPGARVLDVGCGDGQLLSHLIAEKAVDGRGVELSQEGVNACVARGLWVVQGDADVDLSDYPAGAFDYAILSKTLQATHRPREVLDQLLRIGRRAVVSIPNFGYWKVRLNLLATGRMPVTGTLTYPWYETPNIHFCTIMDFVALCGELGIAIEDFRALSDAGQPLPTRSPRIANLTAGQAVFLLRRNGQG